MESNLRPVFSELTDLDMLASRIAEDEDRTRNGSNYDVSSSPVPPSPEASRSQGQGGSAGEASSTKQIQRLSTQSNEGLTSGSGIYGTWESPSTVQHHHQHPIQHHLPSRISWRTPGSPNISASNLILSSQAAKHDVEEDDDGSTEAPSIQKNYEGDQYIELAKKRRVTVRSFKGLFCTHVLVTL